MSDSSFTTIENVGGTLIATPQREKIGDYESPILRGEVEATAPGAGWRIAMDMSQVRLVASAGLGALVAMNQSCKKNGGKLVLFGLDANLKQVFELTKLHRVLSIVGTREEAIKAIG